VYVCSVCGIALLLLAWRRARAAARLRTKITARPLARGAAVTSQ